MNCVYAKFLFSKMQSDCVYINFSYQKIQKKQENYPKVVFLAFLSFKCMILCHMNEKTYIDTNLRFFYVQKKNFFVQTQTTNLDEIQMQTIPYFNIIASTSCAIRSYPAGLGCKWSPLSYLGKNAAGFSGSQSALSKSMTPSIRSVLRIHSL